MHLNLTMFVCPPVERDVKAVEQRTAESKVVVSSGPVIMSQPAQ